MGGGGGGAALLARPGAGWGERRVPGDRRRLRGRNRAAPRAGSCRRRGGAAPRHRGWGRRTGGDGRRVGREEGGPPHRSDRRLDRRGARGVEAPAPPGAGRPRAGGEHRCESDVDGAAPAGNRPALHPRRPKVDLPDPGWRDPARRAGAPRTPRTRSLDHFRLGHLLQCPSPRDRLEGPRLVHSSCWNRNAIPERERTQLARPPRRHPRPLPTARRFVRRVEVVPRPRRPGRPGGRLSGPPRLVRLVGCAKERTAAPGRADTRTARLGLRHGPRARPRARTAVGRGRERPPTRRVGVGPGTTCRSGTRPSGIPGGRSSPCRPWTFAVTARWIWRVCR